jgi:glycosyltransferase involved in cell wall biosynthesis
VLSTWALLVARRVMRRPTILWGHGWPRAGAHARSDRLRHAQRLLATSLVVYTEAQRRALERRMPGKRIVAAPNAMLPRGMMSPAVGDSPPTDFVYVGRLVAEKKPVLLAQAFLRALSALPAETRLVVLGDGPERAELCELAAAAEGRILLPGHVSDPRALHDAYRTAIASVSPGYVGLSLIQSLAFGVPMAIARSEPHSPEIEAAEEGRNAVFFDSDDADALASVLRDFARKRDYWAARREEISARAASNYSLETMVERLAAAISDARSGRRRAP